MTIWKWLDNQIIENNNNGKDAVNGNGNGRGEAGCLRIIENPKYKAEKLTGLSKSKVMISLKGIQKTYKTDAGPFLALKGVNLTVMEGEFVAVVGKSGSGKSTLINMFTGIDHPSEGEVIVANTNIRHLDEGNMAIWRGNNLGIVFQFFQLLPTLTIKENILISMDLVGKYNESERNERALCLLEQFGILDDADKFPNSISQGHAQRAAIARALANDPPILVADEPTGNLDSQTANHIFELFEQLVENGKTILMVTHDNELASRAQRKVTIVDGVIVDEVRTTL